MNEDQIREWIDNASYQNLLSKWRSAPAGDPFFRGEIGQYYSKVMNEKKAQLASGEAVSISKAIDK